MPEPISEQIDATIYADLGTITTAAGFSVTLASVEWENENGNTVGDLACTIFAGDDEDPPPNAVSIRKVGWLRPYWITVYILKDEGDTTEWKTWRNRIRADIEKALMANRQRTNSAMPAVNLADNTIVRPPTSFQLDSGLRGIVVRVDVFYTTRETDPYSL